MHSTGLKCFMMHFQLRLLYLSFIWDIIEYLSSIDLSLFGPVLLNIFFLDPPLGYGDTPDWSGLGTHALRRPQSASSYIHAEHAVACCPGAPAGQLRSACQ
jgi:hypothetical protein